MIFLLCFDDFGMIFGWFWNYFRIHQ